MDIKFLTRLHEDEIVTLINACLALRGDSTEHDYIDWAKVYQEEDRVDMAGNRHFFVNTGCGLRVMDNFRITDYSLKKDQKRMTYDGIAYERSCDNFDAELRVYLANRFGQEYVDSLYAVRLAEIEQEKSLLEEAIAPSR